MAQDPLHVLWVEPRFPGRLGAVADWLVERRGYRATFYCHTLDPKGCWPASVDRGLEIQTFGVGGVAREAAVGWSRALERSLCYSYGAWEVLVQRRPRPIDVIVGRSAGLGSSLFAPVYWPAAPVVNFLDYYYHPHRHDLAEEAGPEMQPAYAFWRRSMAAVELLDLENAALGWTPTRWQRDLYPAEYRSELLVLHDGVDTRRFARPAGRTGARASRSIAGRSVPAGTRVISFVARSLDRLRGFDRFLATANALLRARADVICAIVGEPIVRRGLDVVFHNRDYPAHLMGQQPPFDPDRLWFLGRATPATVAEVLLASDLHLAPSRPFPVARSVLEAMAAGCVVVASDTEPHREVIESGRNGILVGGNDPEALARASLAVLADLGGHRALGEAAAETVRAHYAQDVCLPRLAEQLTTLAGARGGWL